MKEVKMYEALDGKIFKTKKGAENHNKKIVVKEKLEELGMTEEEVAEKLNSIAKSNNVVRFLLEENEWTKWRPHHIKLISLSLLNPKKKTYYYAESMKWGEKYIEIAVEEGEEFTDVNLHLENKEDKYLDYVFEKEKVIDEYTKEVYYKFKYSFEEMLKMKLEDKAKLTSKEIQALVYEYEVYSEEGEEGRWDKDVLSVSEIGGKLYATRWRRGLTESQENSFYEQPYEVKMEEKEVTVIKKVITPVE